MYLKEIIENENGDFISSQNPVTKKLKKEQI